LIPSTGEFTIRARHGVRHLLVVGRDEHPVKTFAINMVAGQAQSDLGELDVSDSCPSSAL
jgi:hypothetical protein